MTGKRFEIGYDDGLLRFVKDNVTNTNLDIVDCWTALNELNDENEQLKTKNFAYLQDIEVFKEENTHLKLENEQLKLENEQLKKELLFFYDIANCECSTNWKGDMEKGCKRFFNCTYEEAKEKYGDYDGMWWELEE